MNNRRRITTLLVGAVSGASFYWGTNILYHASRRDTGPLDILVVSFLLIAISCGVYFALERLLRPGKNTIGLACSMVLGIWIFGPIALQIYGIVSNSADIELDVMLRMILRFPLYTLIISFQDWTILGLIGTSLTLVILSIIRWNWIRSGGVL